METAATFHMHDAMSCAFDRLGCGSLLRMNYPSYPALTAEFLSTLTHEIESRDEDGTISFQLGNERRVVSRTQWNAIFDFPPPLFGDYFADNVSLKTMWKRISGTDNYNPSRPAKHTKIASPIFKLILRLLGNTIYARKENSKPHQKELYVLFKVLHDSNEGLDMGLELLDHLLQYAKLNGELQVGGMVAHLATHFQVNLDLYESIRPVFLDTEYLLSSKITHQGPNLIVSKFGNVNVPFTPGKGHFHTWEGWFETWSGDALPQDWIDRAPHEADRPIALEGRPLWAPEDQEEEPIVEEPVYDMQVYQHQHFHDHLHQQGHDHHHDHQQGRSSSFTAPTSMDELYADFATLRMDVRNIENALQDHRRSCTVRWEDEDRRRAVDEARWQRLDAYMMAGQNRYAQAGSSSQHQTYDTAPGWSDDQHDPSAPQ